MSNWSAGTIGTVWIGMICAGALPATISRTTKRRTTRLVIRHLARLESPDTEDTQHRVGRVTGRRGRRASVALARHGLSRSVFTPSNPLIGHCRVRAVWKAPTATKIPANRPRVPGRSRRAGRRPVESLLPLYASRIHPGDRVTWRTRPQRGSIEETLSRR